MLLTDTQKQQIQELGKEPEKESPEKSQIVVGQFESLLIVGTAMQTVERVVARLTGGSSPVLADEAVQQWTGKFNPRPVGEVELLQLYESAF